MAGQSTLAATTFSMLPPQSSHNLNGQPTCLYCSTQVPQVVASDQHSWPVLKMLSVFRTVNKQDGIVYNIYIYTYV